MVYEHEIPDGCRLYFAKTANLKRKIETIASEILEKNGFSEIVTPFFSYHQHQSINEKQLIRFSDEKNHLVSLRADSTLDVVRLLTRRLGKSTEHKKWFYIQPIFRYPSYELYQIGGEILDSSNLDTLANLMINFFNEIKLKPVLQISNISIPKIISNMLNLSLDVFKEGRLEVLLDQDEIWLQELVTLQRVEFIDKVIKKVPQELKEPLLKMKNTALELKYDNIAIAPLYYSRMRYYDDLFFRFIDKNSLLGSGGSYKFESQNSSGFAIYTDAVIENLIK